MENQQQFDLREKFLNPDIRHRPELFLDGKMLWRDEQLEARLVEYAKAGIGCIIPLITENGVAETGLRQMSVWHDAYAMLLDKILHAGLEVTFVFEPAYERSYLALNDSMEETACAKALLRLNIFAVPARRCSFCFAAMR